MLNVKWSQIRDSNLTRRSTQDEIDEQHLIHEIGKRRKWPKKIESKAALRAECEKAMREFYGQDFASTPALRAAESE